MGKKASQRVCVHCGKDPDTTPDQAALDELVARAKQRFNEGALREYQEFSFITGLIAGWNEHAKRKSDS